MIQTAAQNHLECVSTAIYRQETRQIGTKTPQNAHRSVQILQKGLEYEQFSPVKFV